MRTSCMLSRASRLALVATASYSTLGNALAVPAEVIFNPAPAVGTRGAVASESVECSAIGRDLIARGGNAVDALVGATFCVGVVGMYHSGIGGGGFMMVRDAEGNYEAIDFRESAPAAAYEDMYQGNVNGSIYGGLSVGVPSEVRGLEYAHTKYGALPWEDVMQGAIRIAREGFRLSEDWETYAAAAVKGRSDFLVEEPEWAVDFAPNGTLLKAGDVLKRHRYADTLEEISKQGADVFYTGEIAESMIRVIQETNGTMTLDDLRNYQVKSREVIKITYRGAELHTVGAPASGAVGHGILKIMEQYDTDDWADVNLTMHRFDEAMRFAYSARLALGDPDFVSSMADIEKHMVSEEAAREIRAKILDNKTQPVEAYNPKRTYGRESHGTSHISTADKSGMAASLTTTVNLLFGAQIIDPISGVILNNEMNDFSIPGVPNEFGFVPTEENFIRPGKRPLSSITPVIAARPDGSLLASIGAAGGSRIISATAYALWHALEHDMSLTRALAYPRIHDQLMPNHILVERSNDNATIASLRERGHEIKYASPRLSSVQGVWRNEDGAFEAASEPRQKNSGGLTV